MKHSITRWTMAATAAAVLAMPAPGAAQTSGTATPQTQSATPTAAQEIPEAAREHLSQAKAALAGVETTNLNAKARTQLTELKKRMTALERAAGMNDSASATGQASRNPAATANRGNVNWGTEVAAIDKALTTLLGPASTTGATGTTPPPPTGTSGAAGATGAAAGMNLDATTRTKLTEVRTHITAFATAMAGGKTDTTSDPATTSASSTTSSTMTSGTTSGTASSGTATQQPPTEPQTQTAPTPQVDATAARQHLTEARNTLSAMTQLPAASQLQGEARTHVSQLITNFNELITTQTEWRAAYTKLEANLTALLGPDPAAAVTAAATGTAGATGTTGTTGTTGATAGTSGTGTVELDPAIREKLVELRRNLNEFEKAAGGTSTPASASDSPSPASNPSTPMTTGSTTAAATGTPSTTGTTPTEQPGMETAQASNADVMKHIAAIDALLKMQDDSGGLTLTKVQVEQLRTHWAALRAAIEKR